MRPGLRQTPRRMLVARTLALLILALAPASAAQASTLTQLAAPNGCLTPGAVTGCTVSPAATTPEAVLVRDNHVYVANASLDRVSILDRNAVTGALTPRPPGPAGCIGETNAAGCVDGRALSRPTRLAISPDGTRLYVLSTGAVGVAVLARDPVTGNLSQAAAASACVTTSGTSGACNAAPTLGASVADLTVSGDGDDVYVAGAEGSGNGTISVLDVAAGGLEQHGLDSGGCVRDDPAGTGCADGRALLQPYAVRVTADGRHVYVTSFASASVVALTREAGGGLAPIAGLDGCFQDETGSDGCREDPRLGTELAGLAVAGDDVYVGSRSGGPLTQLRRDAATGGLTFASCVSPTVGSCSPVLDTFGATTLVVAPDGNRVYLGAYFGRGLLGFARGATGELTADPTPAGCLATGGNGPATTCTIPVGFARVFDEQFGPSGVSMSADGRFVYAASSGFLEDREALLVALRPTSPICRDGVAQVVQGTTAELPLDCSDADADTLTYAIVAGPGAGTLGEIDQAQRTVPYQAPDQPGTTSLSYRATTGSGDAARPATLRVEITARPPVAATPTPTPSPEPTATATPGPGVTPRIAAGVRARWQARKRYLLLRKLTVRDVPAGATVTVRCAGGKRRGCPFASRRFEPGAKRRVQAAAPFKGRKLRKGATIEVRVTKPGSIGQVVTFSLARAGRVPKPQRRCLAPGATKPAKTC